MRLFLFGRLILLGFVIGAAVALVIQVVALLVMFRRLGGSFALRWLFNDWRYRQIDRTLGRLNRCRCCRCTLPSFTARWQLSVPQHDGRSYALRPLCESCFRSLEAQTRVFDAFAGPGVMHAAVWKDAAGYVGCDSKWFNDDRLCFVADNRRVLRCIDLSPFTCFDLDAFGSPWEQALIIAARRPTKSGERIGLILTEGTSLKTRMKGMPGALGQAAGVNKAATYGATHDELVDRALYGVARRMRCEVVRHWRAVGVTGAQMRYVGAVLEAAR